MWSLLLRNAAPALSGVWASDLPGHIDRLTGLLCFVAGLVAVGQCVVCARISGASNTHTHTRARIQERRRIVEPQERLNARRTARGKPCCASADTCRRSLRGVVLSISAALPGRGERHLYCTDKLIPLRIWPITAWKYTKRAVHGRPNWHASLATLTPCRHNRKESKVCNGNSPGTLRCFLRTCTKAARRTTAPDSLLPCVLS